jgi:hypothetical protein
MIHTRSDLVEAWRLDLIADAEQAEDQAVNGPFYPESGVTRDMLTAYAAECRQKAEKPTETMPRIDPWRGRVIPD